MIERRPLELATSRFQAADLIRASGLAPVRVTLGAPRFRLGYELAGEVRDLAPTRTIFGLEWEEFRPAYLAQLERVEWPEVERRLRDIAGVAAAPGCVLLCFEDVLAGQRCHRRLLAEHWHGRTGRDVPELGADTRTPHPLRL